MAIFVDPQTPVIETPQYWSFKFTGIQTLTPKLISDQGTFCTCVTQCVMDLPAFTDEIGSDFYTNDFRRMFMNTALNSTVTAVLINSAGQEFPVTDDTYGIKDDNSAALFANSYYTYRLSWFKVWQALGYGTYYMRIENKTALGDVVQSDRTPSFKLRKYSQRAAHGTVRIETIQSGILQHDKSYTGTSDQDTFDQQIRFRGSFKFLTNVVQNSDLQLNNTNRSSAQVKDQVFPEYELLLALTSSHQVAQTLYDYLFANDVRISDYNLFNHVVDPRDYTANAYRSIPIKREDENSEPSVNHVKKTYKIKAMYDYKNVFKINN